MVCPFSHPLPLQHYPSLFSQLLFSSPLYIPSMFTLVSLASPCGSVAANICFAVNAAPPFPAFYHLNISRKKLIYFLTSVLFFLLSSVSPLMRPELATSRLRIKRNGRSESSVAEESIGKAQNGAGTSKLDSHEQSVDVEEIT